MAAFVLTGLTMLAAVPALIAESDEGAVMFGFNALFWSSLAMAAS